MARAQQVHVVWSKQFDEWLIKLSGRELPKRLSNNGTKLATISDAKVIAQSLKGELVIHRMDGKITRKHSYGNDPRGIKG